MSDYRKVIAPERRSVPTPKNMVENGRCVFGTFDKEFETMNLLEIDNPTSAPDFLNRMKLTVWEASEVHLEEGVLLAACCDMGLFGQVLNIFYDKQEKKVYSWADKIPSKRTFVAENLINGAETKADSKRLSIHYSNQFQDGQCFLKGWHEADVRTVGDIAALDEKHRASESAGDAAQTAVRMPGGYRTESGKSIKQGCQGRHKIA